MKKRISVIVPVFNTEKYLKKCIDSICNQTYKNLEIILVDDGSDDECACLCDDIKQLDERIIVIHKENGGLSSARNIGIANATGEYVGFVDSDDYIGVTMYENLITNIEKYDADIAGVEGIAVEEDGTVIEKEKLQYQKQVDIIENSSYVQGLLERTHNCSFCSKLFKRNLFDNYSFKEGRLNEDFLLLIQLLMVSNKIAYSYEPLYYYVQRKGSICHSGFGQVTIDMISNACFALELIDRYMPYLNLYAESLILYQCRTYFILMPEIFLREQPEHYIKMVQIVREKRKIILKAKMDARDKVLLYIMNFSPACGKMLLKIYDKIRRQRKK